MRPVERGYIPTDNQGQPKHNKQYAQAQSELINRIGEYCSYCERPIKTHLAIEHIQSKAYQPQLTLSWDNFLLGCGNCNATKGTHVRDDVTQSHYYWPHLDNTFRAFVYKQGGIIKVNPALNAAERKKAQKTLELTGLDRHPNASTKPTPKDKRWNHRRQVWDLAQQAKRLLALNDNPDMRKFIVKNAKAHGFWSIWMSLFQDDPDMLNRFIQAFPGTCHQCFDLKAKPIERRKEGL
ncbi:MAG: HNH endonuclease [Candidatus Parabeggiatoa sp.]|nr:HNH endonuclease [Candidatus Parabeggiatoa sp.]